MWVGATGEEGLETAARPSSVTAGEWHAARTAEDGETGGRGWREGASRGSGTDSGPDPPSGTWPFCPQKEGVPPTQKTSGGASLNR